ncbi:Met repressor [Vibrio scophthalmi]|uniref:Met repressor n=1 Tax=Vibrio scophthalmi TaxID=45658 RepID=A0A1C7FEA0_9VIBR|nr:Met repressor [Vibrio scophthalmi]
MADWNGEYISPYAEHGKKSEQVKKNYRFNSIKSIEGLN